MELTICILLSISSRCFGNSEAFASEFLEHHEAIGFMLSGIYSKLMLFLTGIYWVNHIVNFVAVMKKG